MDVAAPRVAIAHDYLTQRGGAERVVLAMLRAFPDATIYTTLYDADATYPEFRTARIVVSPLDRVGFLRRNHRLALPVLPIAARSLRIEEDVVVVSSSGWAHGFHASGKRLVYCYSPARWLYQTETYLGAPPSSSNAGRALLIIRPLLRRWDRRAAARASRYLAISRVVQDRIRETYGIDSEVLPAPHNAQPAAARVVVPGLASWAADGYHLIVSRLLPYKNVQPVIEAFASLPDERLVVVGRGPERDRLANLATENVRLVQDLDDGQLRWVYANSTVLVAPSVEDYGLTPLEAGAFGKPTLALRGGGYLDTIREGVNGSFFDDASPTAIRRAVVANADRSWDEDLIREHADLFGEDAFIDRIREYVAALGE
jgi:glycosyltransferase involved in cell wall biosynthesis